MQKSNPIGTRLSCENVSVVLDDPTQENGTIANMFHSLAHKLDRNCRLHGKHEGRFVEMKRGKIIARRTDSNGTSMFRLCHWTVNFPWSMSVALTVAGPTQDGRPLVVRRKFPLDLQVVKTIALLEVVWGLTC